MKVNLDEIIENVREKLVETNIILTGLEEEEKEFASILHGAGLVNQNTIKDIVVYGSSTAGNKKLQQAKRLKTQCYSLDEFKEEFLYEHNAKDTLKDMTVLIDINLDYKSIMPIYLLNPKAVMWSNQVNKRKVQEVDIVISNENNLDNLKGGLKDWLRDKDVQQFSFDGKTLEPHKINKFKKQFTH
jgi:hypothetical protein